MLKNYPIKFTCLMLASLLLSFVSYAKTVEVGSQEEFDSAMNAASSDDVIVWKSGVYKDIKLMITKSKLTIKAKIRGRTVFTGASRVEIKGNNNIFEGFQFLSGKIGDKNVIDIKGSFNRVTQVNIAGYSSWKYLVITASSVHNTVSYCNFENRLNLDDKNILSILVDENTPGKHKIQHCSFRDFKGDGGDLGIEPIRIGVSSQKEFSSQSIVEYCYFTQCNGDGEIISNKSADNVIRYNTFENNPKSELVLRHGDRGIVYGNFFLNGKGGVRVKEGKGHTIFNNYFSGLEDRSIFIQNTKTDPVRNVTIAHNTFVNTAKVRFNSNGDDKPKGIKVYNNLFSNEDTNAISHVTGSEDFQGNFFQGKLGAKKAVKGFTSIKPLLEKNEFGFYQLNYKSPVINKSEAGSLYIPSPKDLVIDANILLDISKNPRPTEEEKKDVGCSEFFVSKKLKPHANKKNTGPSYLSKPKTTPKKTSKAPVVAKPTKEAPAKNVSAAPAKKPKATVPAVSSKVASEKKPVSTESVKKEVVTPAIKNVESKKEEVLN